MFSDPTRLKLCALLDNGTQGKSLSLICAALTWLRNHKKSTFEAAVNDAADAFRDEPDWIIEQMLKRKREEVVQRWEERETRLQRIRAKEKLMEGRGSKRRRVDDSGTKSGASAGTDEDEWLLDEREDQDTQQASETSAFSKEARNLMEKLGMGSLKKEEEEDRIEEPIKVGTLASRYKRILTFDRSTTLHAHIHN